MEVLIVTAGFDFDTWVLICLFVCLFVSITGCVGIVWFFFFMYVVYESPSAHPTITPEERTYIEESIGESLVMIPHKVWIMILKIMIYFVFLLGL